MLNRLMLITIAAGATGVSVARAATFELWPAERRRNNTVYCMGNEYNHLVFSFSGEDPGRGKHKLSLPEAFEMPVQLTFDLPVTTQYLGAFGRGSGGLLAPQTERVKRNGVEYARFTVTLEEAGAKGLTHRILKNSYDYLVMVWFVPPKGMDADVHWQLRYGEDVLAEASSKIVDAGTMDPKAKLPERFGLSFASGCSTPFPENDYDKLVDFYRRVGITGLSSGYARSPTSRPWGRPFLEAMHRAGMENYTTPSESFSDYRMTSPRKYGDRGLVWGAREEARRINTKEEREYFKAVAPYFDKFGYNYEPLGPRRYPGYDDLPTIEAFAKENGIREKLTPELLKGKYRKSYADYRMRLLTLPILAVKELVDSVKPMPILLIQGSGLNPHVDYRLYDQAVDYHVPMVFTASPLDFYTRVLAVARYLDPKKLIGDTSFGYRAASVMRHTPQGAVMDVVGTAAAGCAAFRHWPGLRCMDEGMLYGVHQGMTMVAHGEPFYWDGKETDRISVRGLPYISKNVQVGGRALDLSQPAWRNSLRYHVHKLRNEYLVTLLNFNNHQDAFVEMKSDSLRNCILVNPVTKTHLEVGPAGKAIAKVPLFSPALWFVTKNRTRLTNSRLVRQEALIAEFRTTQAEFKKRGSSDVVLGKQGGIDIGYREVAFGGKQNVCLSVKTENQRIDFSTSGGRVLEWTVNGANIVAKKSISKSGFCMDLLWLPANARWSGDETAEMTLVKCSNNGSVATVVYSGEFESGLPGLRIEKTYRVSASAPAIQVTVRLINGTPLPVSVSYWSHNTLSFDNPGIAVLAGGRTHKLRTRGNSIFPSTSLPPEEKHLVSMQERIARSIGNLYAELNPETQSAVLFQLPDNFMNVYRYNRGSEWRTRPMTIPASQSRDISFAIRVISDKDAGNLAAFRQDLSVSATPERRLDSKNLLNVLFHDADGNGFPDCYKETQLNRKSVHYHTPVGRPDKDNPILRITGSEADRIKLNAKTPARLEQGKQYLFSVQVAVKDMVFTGHWYKQKRGFWIYVYGNNDEHKWMAIAGSGSTDGWVTVMMPINVKNRDFTQSRVFLRVNEMRGTVLLKNPSIIELPAGTKLGRHFIVGDGSVVTGSCLTLSDTQ